MADRYLIENREAAVGVQLFHLRQLWGAAIWRVQTQVLLSRPKYALPGREEAESRRAADTAADASCRSHASGSGARGLDAYSRGAGYGGDVGRADRACGGQRAEVRRLQVTGRTSSCGRAAWLVMEETPQIHAQQHTDLLHAARRIQLGNARPRSPHPIAPSSRPCI
jgi:hypothetical protein